ncbi:DUF308 domain-containing protein [Streptococcus macacae]|uniref:Membrane protein n=1 Tax=Streptococcus macacae NCTC 11558 TaxID=764298 RepID=G5JU01_9STRE|nr:DUF308 domain-containing protein [Streptococcus macacae]EHJ52179.1 putative membrane protein [Streptococcus macacae NCTC 11558]SUN78369.1 acid-resistance membrane protein [Streptococcus macacae NCTC 11558]
MKQSNKLLFVLAGIFYLLIGLLLFVNPIGNLVSLSWLLSLGLFISAISSIVNYFTMPQAFRHSIYLVEGVLNALIALYLITRGFAVLPFVIPSVLGIWLIFEAIVIFSKGSLLNFIFPIIGSSVTWVAILAFLLGLILIINPLGAGVFVMYVLALGFIFEGISVIAEAFREK